MRAREGPPGAARKGYHAPVRTRGARSALLFLAAASVACAGGPSSRVEGGAGALRSREGLCAGKTVPSPSGSKHEVTIVGCLRAGAPGTRFDNGEARLITVLQAEDAAEADLEDWQVLVLRDGERLMNRALDAGPSHRRCSALGLRCRERVADVAAIPESLAPGTYTLRYRVMSEDAYEEGLEPAELTIVLR
jgi:hypothetical protein